MQEGGENLPSPLLSGLPASPVFCGRLPARPPRAFDARRQSIAIARTFDAAAAGPNPSVLFIMQAADLTPAACVKAGKRQSSYIKISSAFVPPAHR